MVASIPDTTRPNPDTSRSDADLIGNLLHLLEQGISDLESICQHLAISPEHVATLLNNRAIQDHLDTRLKLAQAAFRLKVIKLLPQTATALEACLKSDKPEVARRAVTMVSHICNIPTTPPKHDSYLPLGLSRR